jgi:hypothetical protein
MLPFFNGSLDHHGIDVPLDCRSELGLPIVADKLYLHTDCTLGGRDVAVQWQVRGYE